MKSICFYWSKGAEIRRKIILLIDRCNKTNKACFMNILADELKISHVGMKKHIDLLIEEKYISQVNPSGKPIYLQLTKLGKEIVKELKQK